MSTPSNLNPDKNDPKQGNPGAQPAQGAPSDGKAHPSRPAHEPQPIVPGSAIPTHVGPVPAQYDQGVPVPGENMANPRANTAGNPDQAAQQAQQAAQRAEHAAQQADQKKSGSSE